MDQDNQIERIKKILIDWNPLGKSAIKVKDLDNYNIEANDIYFNLDIDVDLPTKNLHLHKVKNMIQEVIEGAFLINIDDQECMESAIRINEILKEK